MDFPELLAPAGNMEKLQTALLYGADAVYVGGRSNNLRAASEGLDFAQLGAAVKEAEQKNSQIFYCLNSLPMQEDIRGLPTAIEEAALAGVHAFIIADPGIFRLAKRYAPSIPIHMSTQTNSTNSESLAFWKDMGASRVNLARELSARDIYAIRKALPDMEIEIFMHGAMCLAVSGQCLLSAWLNKRPANLGQCTHPCRFEYKEFPMNDCCEHEQKEDNEIVLTVAEKTRPNEPVWDIRPGTSDSSSERYSSFWAPQDLCLMPYLAWFVQNNITALKIEGRMKGASYVAHVVDAYRTALDRLKKGISHGSASYRYDDCMQELFHTASRPLGTGFFLRGKRENISERFFPGQKKSTQSLVGKFIEPINADLSSWVIDVRGRWSEEKDIILMIPGLERPVISAGQYKIESIQGESKNIVHSGTKAILHLPTQKKLSDIISGIFVRTL